MIDLSHSRRGYNYRCMWWKRDQSGAMDNEELVIKTAPAGVFYAKISNGKSSDKQDLAGVFRSNVEGVTIETNDVVDIEADDVVLFDGERWVATRVSDEREQKAAEYGRRAGGKTSISLAKGS